MMALGSDPRAVALRVHLLFVFAGAVALGVGSVVLLIAAGVWLGAGEAGALVIRLPALVIYFVAWGVPFAAFEGPHPSAQQGRPNPPGPKYKPPGASGGSGVLGNSVPSPVPC